MSERRKNYLSPIFLIVSTIIALGVSVYGLSVGIPDSSLELTDTMSIPITSMTCILAGPLIFAVSSVIALFIEAVFYG